MISDADKLPIILYAKDVASILRIKEPSARRLMAKGKYGPCVKIGKWAILKSVFLASFIRTKDARQQDDPLPQARRDSRVVEKVSNPKRTATKGGN